MGIFGGSHFGSSDNTPREFLDETKNIGPLKNGSRNSQFVCDFLGPKKKEFRPLREFGGEDVL